MAYAAAPSPKSVRIIAEATPGTLPGTAMDVLPCESFSPSGLGTGRTQAGNVAANRHHPANIPTGSNPAASLGADLLLGPCAGHRKILEGVTDRAATTGNSYTAATIALTGGVLIESAVGGWATTASWLVAGTAILVEGLAAGPFLTFGPFWAFVTDVTGANATLSSLLPIPADMAEGASVRIRFTRSYLSTPASNDVMLTYALEVMSASGKGDEWLRTAWTEYGYSLPDETGVLKMTAGLVGTGLPIKLTAALANGTTAFDVTTAPAMGGGVDFGAHAEPNSGGALRLNSVTLSDLLLKSLSFKMSAGAAADKGGGSGLDNKTLRRDGFVTSGLDFTVERATTQSDDLIDLLRDVDGSTVPVSHGWLDAAGNRRLFLGPQLDLGEEGDSGVKQDGTQQISVSGMFRPSSLISQAYWLIVDADAV